MAVIDAGGRLLLSTSVTTDTELDQVLTPWLDGPCLLAMDAPLIVVNATGRRPCEAAISRAFAAQHAGTYPSNTSLPVFAGGGRAAAFARRHRLDVDATHPSLGGQRRAIEVYPHSATVALFGLPRVLPYKARPGRTLETRRLALARFVALLEELSDRRPALLDTEDALGTLQRAIAVAPTAAAIRRLEDPVDAIMCGYVGLLFLEGSAAVIGDAMTGAIVTPVDERHRRLLGLD